VKNVTFCVQGPLRSGDGSRDYARVLVESIHKYFPYSPVVISTWESERKFTFTSKEKLIFSQDPGSQLRYLDGEKNNINRQIKSSQVALSQVNTEFSVKVRSDLVFHSNNLLRVLPLIDGKSSSTGKFALFEQRIVVLDRLTFSPARFPSAGLSLHVSDHFQMGRTDDLSSFWNIPRINQFDETAFFSDAVRNEDMLLHIPRWRAEQYFWIMNIKKRFPDLGTLDSWKSSESDLNFKSEEFFFDNIIPAKTSTLGLKSQKYRWSKFDDLVSSTYAYSFKDWSSTLKDFDGFEDRAPVFLWEDLGYLYSKSLGLFHRLFRS